MTTTIDTRLERARHAIPDPESQDATILAALETVRNMRAAGYRRDLRGEGELPEAEVNSLDEEMRAQEALIFGTYAQTVPGIIAKLELALLHRDAGLATDVAFAIMGFPVLFAERASFDSDEQIMLDAIRELYATEWGQALASYERARDNFSALLNLQTALQEEVCRLRKDGAALSPTLQEAVKLAEDCHLRLSDSEALIHLVQTVAPDMDAYTRKADIAIEAGYAEEAAPYLLRDIQLLTSRFADAERMVGAIQKASEHHRTVGEEA